MGISLFNPPEPCGNRHRGCGNCTSVPCKWLLRIPAHGDVPPVDLLLSRIGKTGCHWGRMVRDGLYPESTLNHPFYDQWRLSFSPFVDVAIGPFIGPGFIPDWVVWIEGRETLGPGAVGGDSVYYRKTPLILENHPDYNVENLRSDFHFSCLGPNRFYYWDSFNDPSGDGPGWFYGWPNELEVIPWYGKDQT